MRVIEMLTPIWDTVKGVLPLTSILLIIQLVILRKPVENVKDFSMGILFAIIGLHFFLQGSNMSLIPLGESVGRNLYILDRRWVIVLIGFVIGYLGTLVEPALSSLALEVEEMSAGVISQKLLINAVAAGFGLGMSLGLFKIMNDIQYIKILVPLLILVIVLAFLTPEPYVSIAMDSASATTGPVNIPLNMALAIGLASIIEGADPLLSGFGVVGLTSVGAMVSVLLLGLSTRF